MILQGLNIFGTKGLQNIHIKNGKILAVLPANTDVAKKSISFANAVAFPGLINSHDHLDFNLFPQMGNRQYENYTQWGKDIHEKNKAEMNAVLNVPQALRVLWGLYKNLLCGVTTVVNHGEKLSIPAGLIDVYQKCISLHSPAFEKNITQKIRYPFNRNKIVVMHLGEGTDELAFNEIGQIIKLNSGKKKIIAVHAVAMNEEQAKNFHAMIWCPDSNYFLLGKTAETNELKKSTNILFGSDSTLSADWNIWKHLRLAKKEAGFSDEALIDTITTNAAQVWGFKNKGVIAPKMQADIVVAKNMSDDIFDTDPQNILLVIKKGAIKLFDASLVLQLKNAAIPLADFYKINISGQDKYVHGDLPALANKIKRYYPAALFPFSIFN